LNVCIKKAEKHIKINEMLEKDVLKNGIEKINSDDEMEGLKKEIKKRDEENKEMK
jgi:hypothetical protein